MESSRGDSRKPNQLRPLACTRGILNQAHGSASWSQGGTKVLAAVYGPRGGTKKNENPEQACFEVIWKPKTGLIGKVEKEYEKMVEKTVKSICVLDVNPNTTTTVIIQVTDDDGALLPCAINATCAALVDAGIPLKNLAVAICCCIDLKGNVFLDPNKLEEQTMKASVSLVFPNSNQSLNPKGSKVEGDIITSTTHGAISAKGYFQCLERGHAASTKLSDFLRRNLQQQVSNDSSKAE